MQRVHLNGVDLEYDVQGAGEPLVLIHGRLFGCLSSQVVKPS
jgi:pimeloyl-ACP methyl ester carboxylesterase